jgi:hypothetical protein
MHEGEVSPPEIGIHAGCMRGGLPEDDAEERAALLGDVAEMILVRGRIDGGRQADVADDVLAVVKAGHGSQHDDCALRTDAGGPIGSPR